MVFNPQVPDTTLHAIPHHDAIGTPQTIICSNASPGRFRNAVRAGSRPWASAGRTFSKALYEKTVRFPKVSSSQNASILGSYQRIREVAVADGRSGQSAQIGDTGRKRTSDSIFKLMPWDYRRVVFACFPIRTQQDSPR